MSATTAGQHEGVWFTPTQIEMVWRMSDGAHLECRWPTPDDRSWWLTQTGQETEISVPTDAITEPVRHHLIRFYCADHVRHTLHYRLRNTQHVRSIQAARSKASD